MMNDDFHVITVDETYNRFTQFHRAPRFEAAKLQELRRFILADFGAVACEFKRCRADYGDYGVQWNHQIVEPC